MHRMFLQVQIRMGTYGHVCNKKLLGQYMNDEVSESELEDFPPVSFINNLNEPGEGGSGTSSRFETGSYYTDEEERNELEYVHDYNNNEKE